MLRSLPLVGIYDLICLLFFLPPSPFGLGSAVQAKWRNVPVQGKPSENELIDGGGQGSKACKGKEVWGDGGLLFFSYLLYLLA
ncbi:hypothetical protein GGR56DRAFT_640200 [Xylariaceae sp. FL0804]|nr:hypothetical protein GGR56DRAFT_640200 [Xylariaceae sp. FL0804]